MKVGITLPQFRATVEPALRAARAAEALELDGVFVFDHLWAIGHPDRPAQNVWPLLGALAGSTQRVRVGSLVARVSLLPNAVLAHNFETLHRMIGDRLIAGLGSGDHLSVAENTAVGMPFPPRRERLRDLADVCRRVRALGTTVWIGGLSAPIRQLAGAEKAVLNLWGVDPARVAEVTDVEVTWAGKAPATAIDIASLLRALDDAGATWAVLGPPYSGQVDAVTAVQMVAEAVAALR